MAGNPSVGLKRLEGALRRYGTAGYRGLRTLGAFLRHVTVLFVFDGSLTSAGALSYTLLVALIPLTAIALAVLSAFPIFAGMRDQLLASLFHNFVPEVGAEVEWWFRYFAGTTVQTTALGVLALAITSILLLVTIEEQLHRIWRVRVPRPWLQRVLAYWAILTLGPLLLGVSFSLPSYIDLLARHAGIDADALLGSAWLRHFLLWLPFVLEVIAITLLYAIIPNCAVRWREAAVGALAASVLLELLKMGFAVYLSRFSSYRAVYGALAAIPIFLLWMYLAWAVVMFGAVVAAEMPRWRIDARGVASASAAERLGLSLALLAELVDQARRGGPLTTAALARRLGVATAAVDEDLLQLQEAGFVAAATAGGWVLARSLDDASLRELYLALKMPLVGSLAEAPPQRWERRIAGVLKRIANAEGTSLGVSIADLLATPRAAAVPHVTPSFPRTS